MCEGAARPAADARSGVFANNPAMCALVSAYKLFPQAKEFMLVSLGTGSLERPIPYAQAKDWGLVHWARPLLNVLFDGNADTTSYETPRSSERRITGSTSHLG
jgi:hypothetical protein